MPHRIPLGEKLQFGYNLFREDYSAAELIDLVKEKYHDAPTKAKYVISGAAIHALDHGDTSYARELFKSSGIRITTLRENELILYENDKNILQLLKSAFKIYNELRDVSYRNKRLKPSEIPELAHNIIYGSIFETVSSIRSSSLGEYLKISPKNKKSKAQALRDRFNNILHIGDDMGQILHGGHSVEWPVDKAGYPIKPKT
ncbi:MAG: hypothetical protein V1648_00535 [Candidatus Aenigmatarchaeota archaeon]